MSNSMPIASPVRTQAIVNRYFMHAKKNLGQNFLVDLPQLKELLKQLIFNQVIKLLKLDQELVL
jgi:hypothetical protein